MKIRFIQPFSYELNIGQAYNEAVAELPSDCWVCITDQDTLKFDSFAHKVQQIAAKAPKNALIGCYTNRLRKTNQAVFTPLYDNADIDDHYDHYNRRWDAYGTQLERCQLVAGVFMLFHKSLWESVKFREDTYKFDAYFSNDVQKAGGQLLLAKGLYIFHLYRWGQRDPENYLTHLEKNN